jgi:hypothetical protein|tara:strand:+ start:752 stop:1060 length:309 start_codon:yes stop_codon:yes gene_type:complete
MQPNLIDNQRKYMLKASLNDMHSEKMTNYMNFLNIAVFVLFFSVFGLYLFFKKKHKLTDEQKKAKAFKEQQYILSRIKGIQEDEFEKQRLEGIHEFPTINKY